MSVCVPEALRYPPGQPGHIPVANGTIANDVGHLWRMCEREMARHCDDVRVLAETARFYQILKRSPTHQHDEE